MNQIIKNLPNDDNVYYIEHEVETNVFTLVSKTKQKRTFISAYP